MTSMRDLVRDMIDGKVPQAPVARHVGFRLVGIEDDVARFEMEAGPQHANPMGTLHGGVLCDIADAAMGVAYASVLSDGESFTTLELKMNFLRPFWSGRLVAEGRVAHRGKTVGLVECDIKDEKGRLIARATSTCMTLRGPEATGRSPIVQ